LKLSKNVLKVTIVRVVRALLRQPILPAIFALQAGIAHQEQLQTNQLARLGHLATPLDWEMEINAQHAPRVHIADPLG
jgi:hypothetical protein